MDEKLEPCPFCGAAYVFVLSAEARGRAYVFCDECDAEGPRSWGGADEAIRLWNTRKQKEPTK